MDTLRSRTVRLAYANPLLRPHLLPLLRVGKSAGPVYLGVFFPSNAMSALHAWWEEEVGTPLFLDLANDPHVTLKFKPSMDEILAQPIGKSMKVTILGWAEGD